MKRLTTDQLIEICEASPAQVENAAQLLGRIFETDASFLEIGLKTGFYQASAVKVDSVDRYLLVYHVNDQNVLFINAAVQLSPEFSDFSALIDGLKMLAKTLSCRAIECITLRAGLVKKLLAENFQPIGVSLSFNL